jgi:hypothetical protein
MIQLIFSPVERFVRHPSLARLIAIVFVAAFADRWLGRTRPTAASVGPAAAARVWCAYGVYDWRIPPDMNIRVDLLLIAPVLWFVSGLGLLGYVVGGARRGGGRGFPVEYGPPAD